MTSRRRSPVLRLVVDPELADAAGEAAARAGLSVSSYLRALVVRELSRLGLVLVDPAPPRRRRRSAAQDG